MVCTGRLLYHCQQRLYLYLYLSAAAPCPGRPPASLCMHVCSLSPHSLPTHAARHQPTTSLSLSICSSPCIAHSIYRHVCRCHGRGLRVMWHGPPIMQVPGAGLRALRPRPSEEEDGGAPDRSRPRRVAFCLDARAPPTTRVTLLVLSPLQAWATCRWD